MAAHDQPPLAPEILRSNYGLSFDGLRQLGLATLATLATMTGFPTSATAREHSSSHLNGEIGVIASGMDPTTGKELPIAPGTLIFEESCGGPNDKVVNDEVVNDGHDPQLLGSCPTGSVKITELTSGGPLNDATQQWEVVGSKTRELTVDDRPVTVRFVNRPRLNGAGQKMDGAYYYYVNGSYSEQASGVEANIAVADPTLGPNGQHSLTELAAMSLDGTDVVEAGSTVDPAENGDSQPHWFTGAWVNGKFLGYNGNGFVEVPNPEHIVPGEALMPGTTVDLKLVSLHNQWVIYDDGNEIGYYPASLWGGSFTKAGEERAFGEVTSTSPNRPSAEMGNGISGTRAGSIAVKNFKVIDGSSEPSNPDGNQLSVTASAPKWYTERQTSANSFTLGGSGCDTKEAH
jgi:hypothetical protein